MPSWAHLKIKQLAAILSPLLELGLQSIDLEHNRKQLPPGCFFVYVSILIDMDGNIIQLVPSSIQQCLDGAFVEHNKFDFKRKWYDLKRESGKIEFLKDTPR